MNPQTNVASINPLSLRSYYSGPITELYSQFVLARYLKQADYDKSIIIYCSHQYWH